MHPVKPFVTFVFLFFCHTLVAQSVYLTRNGQISFFSKTPLEDIKALNKNVYSTINTETGAVQFLLKITDFEFKYSAMQQHFNDEDYMYSEKYPNALFKGKIVNKDSVDFSRPGKYSAVVDGELTMHGVTNKVKTTVAFVVNPGQFSGTSVFNVKLEDYKIKVPKIVFNKVAEVVEVRVTCTYQPYKN